MGLDFVTAKVRYQWLCTTCSAFSVTKSNKCDQKIKLLIYFYLILESNLKKSELGISKNN